MLSTSLFSRSRPRKGRETTAFSFGILWPIWACHCWNQTESKDAQFPSTWGSDQGLQRQGRSSQVENRFQKEEINHEPDEYTGFLQGHFVEPLRPTCALCFRLESKQFAFRNIWFSLRQLCANLVLSTCFCKHSVSGASVSNYKTSPWQQPGQKHMMDWILIVTVFHNFESSYLPEKKKEH